MESKSELVPLLVVQGAASAIDFYVRALGAKVLARYEHGPARHVSHADLAIADAAFAVTEEARAWNSDAPPSLGGSPVLLQLSVADADATLASMCAKGATVVFPMQELFGERMARVRDPFGHLWILRQCLEELSTDQIQRQRDALFAEFGAEAGSPAEPSPPTPRKDKNSLGEIDPSPQAPERKARIHLIIGPVGAGKTTFGLKLARDQAAVRLTLDQWMTVLFRQDRPEQDVMEWYAERAARCVEQIWTVALGLLDLGADVVLEIGLLRRHERDRFYRRVRNAGCDLTVYVLDAARDVRRERVEERNRTRGLTFSMVVPPAIFELASDHWEPPDPLECEGRELRFIRTDAAAT